MNTEAFNFCLTGVLELARVWVSARLSKAEAAVSDQNVFGKISVPDWRRVSKQKFSDENVELKLCWVLQVTLHLFLQHLNSKLFLQFLTRMRAPKKWRSDLLQNGRINVKLGRLKGRLLCVSYHELICVNFHMNGFRLLGTGDLCNRHCDDFFVITDRGKIVAYLLSRKPWQKRV